MDLASPPTVFVAIFLLFLSPGPLLALIVSRCARGGVWSGFRASIGSLMATLILLAVALAMLWGAVQLSERALAVMRWVSIVLLFWLGFRMLRASREAAPVGSGAARDVVDGFIVGGSSPFMLVFYVALLTQFVPSEGFGGGAIEVAAAVVAGEAAGAGVTLILAARAVALPLWACRWIERTAAGFLMVSGGIALMNSLGG